MLRLFLLALLIWGAMVILACSDPALFVGTYQSVAETEHRVVLELQPNGRGTWETDYDVISFRWKQRGQEIWLHTRTGGVIIGDIVDMSRLRVDIPGVGVIVMERQ